MGQEKWWGIQLKRSSKLHHGPEPRRYGATVGKYLGQPPVTKNQNVEMDSTSQLNSNLRKPLEKELYRSISVSPPSIQGGNNKSTPR